MKNTWKALLLSLLLALPSLAGCGDETTKEDADAAGDADARESNDFRADDTTAEDAAAEEAAEVEPAEEDVAAEDATVEDAAIDETAAEDPGVEDVATEDVATEDVVAEEASAEDPPIEDVMIEDISIEDVRVEDVAIDDAPVEDLSVEDLPIEDLAIEDLAIDDLLVEETPSPVQVVAVDYPVIAHGARLVVTGTLFTGATSVTIGAASQTFTVDSATQITIASVADATPIGAQGLVVTAPAGTSPAFSMTVIHLVINELDADTPGYDAAEFVEISTGVAGVSLAGYVLVLWNGSGIGNPSYLAVDLGGSAAVTDASGLLLVGNAGVTPTPQITFANSSLQNGADGASIHQGLAALFPIGTPCTTIGIVDALVYDTADPDDPDLLLCLLDVGPQVVQVDESANGDSGTDSIQRCPTQAARLDGRVFKTGPFATNPPSPKALNTACP